MNAKLIQPSVDRPSRLVWVNSAAEGIKVMTSTCTALEAKYVCTPYQTMPTIPRTVAARLAPITPKDRRATTGNGMPYFCDGLPIRFIRK
ncbi:hypothetical protein D3C86_1470730 [compost metagenome]